MRAPAALAFAGIAVSLAFFPMGCGTAVDPWSTGGRILFANASEVAITTELMRDPDGLAQRTCRGFGKNAVYYAEIRPDDYGNTRLIYYNCR